MGKVTSTSVRTRFGDQQVVLVNSGEWWRAFTLKEWTQHGRPFYKADGRASPENFTRVAKEVWEEKERDERQGRTV